MSGSPYSTERLQCYQGVDLDESRYFFIPPASGSTDVQNLVPLDLTGASLRMNIRSDDDPASTSLLSLTTGSGLTLVSGTFSPGPALPTAPNGVKIVITRAQSLAMNSGVAIRNAYYDVLADLAGGTTIMLMAGGFDLLPTVSR